MQKKMQKKKPKNQGGFSYNKLIWLIVFALIAAASYFEQRYAAQVAGPIRASIMIALLIVGVLLIYTTSQGKKAWSFMRTSKTEMRKVVWPTRQETLQTSGIVIVMVGVATLLIGVMDTVFLKLIGLLTG
jgi:preprotein translocase subunit SecE